MKPRLLAIDDEVHWLETFKRFIPSTVADLHCASTPAEAIDLLRRYYYDLVLLDLSMDPNNPTDRSNRYIQRYLATRPEGTRYIITSGTVNVEETREAAFFSNASDVLQKQKIEPDLVLQSIARALADTTQQQRFLTASAKQQWLGDQINEHDTMSELKIGAELLGQITMKLGSELAPVIPHPTHSKLVAQQGVVGGIFWSRKVGSTVGLVLRRPGSNEADGLHILRVFGDHTWTRHGEERTMKSRVVVDVFTTETGPEEFAPSFRFPFAFPLDQSPQHDLLGDPIQSPADPAPSTFDVFLAYNSQDRALAEDLAERLRSSGIAVWLDREQIPPGRWFQDVIQTGIPNVRAAAILLGSGGLGKWQALELRAFISKCIDDDIPVIPVLLPGVDELPGSLLFLRELHFVRFRDSIDDSKALATLEWGITGVRPAVSQKLL